MAAIANITVKKNDGTTDIVYVAKTGSAGDNSPAVWIADSSALIRGNRTTFQMWTSNNGPRTARKVRCAMNMAALATVNGVETRVATGPAEVNFTLPSNADEAMLNELVSQFINLLNSASVKAAIKAGYADN